MQYLHGVTEDAANFVVVHAVLEKLSVPVSISVFDFDSRFIIVEDTAHL